MEKIVDCFFPFYEKKFKDGQKLEPEEEEMFNKISDVIQNDENVEINVFKKFCIFYVYLGNLTELKKLKQSKVLLRGKFTFLVHFFPDEKRKLEFLDPITTILSKYISESGEENLFYNYFRKIAIERIERICNVKNDELFKEKIAYKYSESNFG